MADELHDACDLVGSDHTAPLAFTTDLWGHVVLVGFENGSLMETDGCRVDIHVDKDNIGVIDTRRQS